MDKIYEVDARTYEILAKWIGEQSGATVKFEDGACPNVNIKTKVITLPTKVPKETYATLAHLFHEAGHIKYTNRIPDTFIQKLNKTEHSLLNAIEDVRIDRKMMNRLPNVRSFYENATRWEVKHREKIDIDKIPFHKKSMMNAMYDVGQLPDGKIPDKKIDAFNMKHGIQQHIRNGVFEIQYSEWPKLKSVIDKLIEIYDLKDDKKKQNKDGKGKDKNEDGKGKDSNSKDSKKGEDSKKSKDSKSQDSKGKKKKKGKDKTKSKSNKKKKKQPDFDLDKLKGSQDIWGGKCEVKDDKKVKSSPVELEDRTKRKFKDLLYQKNIKTINDGTKINTDNLTAFFTGDIEGLFVEDKVKYILKSKIHLLLDASGSMDLHLMDNVRRKHSVISCVKSMIQLLKEVRAEAGLNVDYSLSAFNRDHHPLSKRNWVRDYMKISGTTHLHGPFEKVKRDIANDNSIDGNKIIIIITDGQIPPHEIDHMQKSLINTGKDIRCMIIGVGATVGSKFVKKVIGSHNIISSTDANRILLETIMETL